MYRFIRISVWLICVWALLPAPSPGTARAQDRQPQNSGGTPAEKTSLSALSLYQHFISRADGDRCPMYPTCSRYAKQAFEKEGFIRGWILTCDRLLRCGRDETRLSRSVTIDGVRHTYDPLDANTFWWKKR